MGSLETEGSCLNFAAVFGNSFLSADPTGRASPAARTGLGAIKGLQEVGRLSPTAEHPFSITAVWPGEGSRRALVLLSEVSHSIYTNLELGVVFLLLLTG